MNKLISILVCFSFINIYSLDAQTLFKKKKNKKEKNDIKKLHFDDINTKTKDCIKYEGLFNLYQNKKDGKSFIEIDSSQIDGEFI